MPWLSIGIKCKQIWAITNVQTAKVHLHISLNRLLWPVACWPISIHCYRRISKISYRRIQNIKVEIHRSQWKNSYWPQGDARFPPKNAMLPALGKAFMISDILNKVKTENGSQFKVRASLCLLQHNNNVTAPHGHRFQISLTIFTEYTQHARPSYLFTLLLWWFWQLLKHRTQWMVSEGWQTI